MNGERAGARLEADLGPVRGRRWFALDFGVRRVRRELALGRLRERLLGSTGVRIRDGRSGRVVHEIDCGPDDPMLVERTLAMVEADLRAKTLEEFLNGYGIDPRRVPA
jgi:hypothetical protein